MTPLEQAFERFYLRDRDPNSPITRDALVRGADGQYFHQHTRTYLAYFEAGFGHGMATATEAMLEAAQEDQPRIDPDKDKVAPLTTVELRKADPYCWDCNGAGDGKGGQCPTCWTHPF